MTSVPVVAVVGYPNVGKSTLFNRMVGRRDAVVAAEPGVTRDRKSTRAEWGGRSFEVLDTGGIDLSSGEELSDQVRAQAEIGIAEAQLVLMVLDGTRGVGPQEQDIAGILRRSNIPVIPVVNKIDTRGAADSVWEAWELGLGEPFGVSAEHGLGMGDLLDAIVSTMPEVQEQEGEEEGPNIAIVGRPNVGKSSLLNALLGDERTIVSHLPGTTRDAIDTPLVFEDVPVRLVDTAGLRRPGRRSQHDVEYYSALRAVDALRRADVALLVVDAQEGLVDLDLQIAYEAQRAHCATAVLLNKWDVSDMNLDLVTGRLRTKIRMRPPWLTVSAQTGRNVGRILPLALDLYTLYSGRIATGDLNRWVEGIKSQGPQPQEHGKQLKIFYGVQYEAAPPRFRIMVNSRRLVTRNYASFLENRLREDYDLWGIPLIIDFAGKEERYS